MPNLTGLSLGRYQQLEPLGEGGMAVVYKAYDTRLECNVAVKVIRTERFTPEMLKHALKRFEREAKAVAKLTHSNIVKVTDYGEYEGNPYLIMEYLPGGTLKDLINQHGQIPWREAVQLLIPIAEALGYAHSQGIIHRDIKPSNILLTTSGQPMLTDFGVAKVIDEDATQGLTGTNASIGTPEYMAPEQIGSKNVDARADLYALGVVFYEMVTGRRPFEADTPLGVMVKQTHDPLPRPGQFVKELPLNVDKFLLKALTKAPADRYPSAEEMAGAMKKLSLERYQLRTIKPIKEKLTVQSKNRLPKRTIQILRWTIAAMLSAILLASGGFLLVKFTVDQDKPTFGITETRTATKVDPTANLQVEFTTTPELSPTFPITSTQNVIKTEIHTNCRNYPAASASKVFVIEPEETIEINGISSSLEWVYVVYKNQGCWIHISNFSLSMDYSDYALITPVPKITVWNVRASTNLSYQPFEWSNQKYVYCSYKNINSYDRAVTLGNNCCNTLKSKFTFDKPCIPYIDGPYYLDSVDGYEIYSGWPY